MLCVGALLSVAQGVAKRANLAILWLLYSCLQTDVDLNQLWNCEEIGYNNPFMPNSDDALMKTKLHEIARAARGSHAEYCI